jgi:4-amino-4-deoxy-L-arabinose transferase-like glycosyltransferase
MTELSDPKRNLIKLLILTACCAVIFMGALGALPLTDRDEGEYAAAAAEMVRTGDYLSPRLNDRYYFEKPILIFWLVAGSYLIFGHNEFAVRLPSAVAAVLLVLLVFIWAKREFGERAGLWSAACLTLCLGTLIIGRMALTDMPLTLLTTAALFAYFRAMHPASRPGRWWFRLAFLFMGLAFLTKGPVALAVCLGVAGAHVLLNRRLVQTLKKTPWLSGLALFAVVALPWYIAAWLIHGQPFITHFFLEQNLYRLTRSLLGLGPGLLLYLPVILIAFFPWIGLAVPAATTALTRTPRSDRVRDPAADLVFFAGIWVVVVFVVFSFAQTKLPSYIYPLFPALALLSGRAVARLQEGSVSIGSRLVSLSITVLVGLLLAGVIGALPWLFPSLIRKLKFNYDAFEYAFGGRPPDLIWVCLAAAAGLAVMTLSFALVMRRPRGRKGWVWLAAITGLGLGLVVGPLQATLLNYLQQPARQMALTVRNRAHKRDVVLTYALWKPTLFFYLDRKGPVDRIRYGGNPDERARNRKILADRLAGPDRVWVITRRRLEDDLKGIPHFKTVRRAGGYLLGVNRRFSQR